MIRMRKATISSGKDNSIKSIIEEKNAEIVVKKSKFIASIFKVENKEQAGQALESVRKKYFDAKHNCYVYRVSEDGTIVERASDDGEPSGTAGAPMLDILKKNDIVNVLIVVTRYFGGILLGTGGLVKAYSDSTKLAIENSGLRDVEIGDRVIYTISYDNIQKLQYICNKNNIKIENIEYGENILVNVIAIKEKVNLIDNSIDILNKDILEDNVIF